MQLMNAASTNSLEVGIYRWHADQAKMEGEVLPVGVSLDPSFALLNHSCDPNTIRINCNGRSILIANRTILEGQEVTVTYYDSYVENESEARRSYLKRKYCFDCQCQPCSDQWPTKDDIPKSFDDLRENQLLIDFDNTKVLMQQVQKIQKLGSSISQEQRKGSYKKAFGLCIEFIKVLEETVKRPHAYYLMAEKSLFKLAWILHGSAQVGFFE